jgi:hypothetical protein
VWAISAAATTALAPSRLYTLKAAIAVFCIWAVERALRSLLCDDLDVDVLTCAVVVAAGALEVVFFDEGTA